MRISSLIDRIVAAQGTSGAPSVCNRDGAAFTLVELLTVMAIITVLIALVAPAFTNLGTAGNITKATYDLADTLEGARAYATANNTYVWVGFFEETPSLTQTTPVTAGTGRIVLSLVASKDGTMIYDPNNPPANPGTVMTQALTQITKLVKIDNMHVVDLTTLNPAAVTGTLAARPVVSGASARIGSTPLATGTLKQPFQYPLGNPVPMAQYVFKTALQFSPRGEAKINDATQTLQPIIEIGLQPTRGATVDARSVNLAAVQVTGITGNVKIYRP